MDFKAANDYITQRMLRDLPGKLYYHGMHHTLDVCRAVDEIAQGEKVHGDDLILLRTAAIYHDIGFVVEYNHNEELATEIAGHTLPSYHYAPEQIDIIKKIILSTRVPQTPETHLEKIICDADLDYLGREDFFDIAETLKKEWLAHNIIHAEGEWPAIQLKFLERHRYFTKTAIANREAKKQQHISQLKRTLT